MSSPFFLAENSFSLANADNAIGEAYSSGSIMEARMAPVVISAERELGTKDRLR